MVCGGAGVLHADTLLGHLFVPQSAVARSAEQTYLMRVRNGKTEEVSVKTGASVGNLTEVFGDIHAGDEVALHPSDDLHPGAEVAAHVQAMSS